MRTALRWGTFYAYWLAGIFGLADGFGGYCSWSGCDGVPQGLEVCNYDQPSCESCGGLWCTNGYSYCNWGGDGTGECATCNGNAEGGEFCSASQSNCETNCSGRWCTNSDGPPLPALETCSLETQSQGTTVAAGSAGTSTEATGTGGGIDSTTNSQWHGNAFTPKSVPCEIENADTPRGLYYIRVPKTNASHWSDVAERAALHRSSPGRDCFLSSDHVDASGETNLRHRDRDRSLLFAFMREPREWKIAMYYHNIAKKGQTPSAAKQAKYVRKFDNGLSRYLRLLDSWEDYGHVYGAHTATEIARAIISEYDFIGIGGPEADKSMAVMGLLFGLDATETVYNPSHLAGTITFRKTSSSPCTRIPPSYVFPEVEEIMFGEAWLRENAVDLALYQELQKTIDTTITSLGRDRFEGALKQHQDMMDLVREACLPTVRYRCLDDGTVRQKTDCKLGGCGYHCIQNVVGVWNPP